MTPEFRPLLNRDARRRAAEVHEGGPWAASDPLLATSFDFGSHSFTLDDMPAALLAALHTVEHVERASDGRTCRVPVPLWVGAGNRRQVPVGLRPLINQYVLQRSGQRPLVRVPNADAYSHTADPLVPAALAAYGRAVVRLGAKVSIACIISGLVASFPGERIAVFVSRRRDGGHLVRQLTDLGVLAHGFYEYAITPGRPPGVVVGTSAGLASPSARFPHCGIVVVVDPVAFCGQSGVGLRSDQTLVTARWLGLVPAGRQLPPLERDVVTAFFGPFWFSLPAHAHVERKVVFAEQRHTLPAGGGAERVLMRLANELAAGGTTTRPSHFGVVNRAASLMGGPVAVLAHGDHQRRRLLRSQRRADRGRMTVVTTNELADLTELGVLVRADRRVGRPPLPYHLLVELQADRRPLLVIDTLGLDDGNLDCKRAVEYRSVGWLPLDAELGGFVEWDAWVHRRLPGHKARCYTDKP